MAEYHVNCGIAAIYAGIIKPNGYEWKNKSDVTQEALNACSQYLLDNKKIVRFSCRGKKYALQVVELDGENECIE